MAKRFNYEKDKAYYDQRLMLAERALKERCYKMALDTMRIMPYGPWRPLQFANKIHGWVIGELKENLDKLAVNPYEDLT